MAISFSKITCVGGVDDLFELVNYKTDNVFLKSLKTQQVSVFSTNRHKVMTLENIQVYTTGEMMPLKAVFDALREMKATLPEEGATKEAMYEFFLKVVPNMDVTKVYMNNLKQILKWHKILLGHEYE